jgi:hypothetical protein
MTHLILERKLIAWIDRYHLLYTGVEIKTLGNKFCEEKILALYLLRRSNCLRRLLPFRYGFTLRGVLKGISVTRCTHKLYNYFSCWNTNTVIDNLHTSDLIVLIVTTINLKL